MSTAVALAAHALALVALRTVAPRAHDAPPAEIASSFLEIETEPALQEEKSGPLEAPDAPRAAAAVALRDSPSAAASAAIAAGAPEATAPAAKTDVVTAPDGEGWSFRSSSVDLGIDPKKRALVATGPSRAEAPAIPGAAPASTTGGLAEGLDAHDLALGLGRGGVVNTAVHDAVQGASVMGKAIFAVTIDSAGTVTVGVSSASQDEVGWARLNESIRASVVARKDQIRLPPGAHGLRIAVEAEAKEQFPNGRKPSDLGTRGVAKGPSVTETKDHVEINLPDVGIEHRGKVCDVKLKLGIPPISGGCNPENIGTIAQRIVTARVVSESRL